MNNLEKELEETQFELGDCRMELATAKRERDQAKAQAVAELREALVNGKRYERTGQRLLIEQDGGEWFHARDVLAALSTIEQETDE